MEKEICETLAGLVEVAGNLLRESVGDSDKVQDNFDYAGMLLNCGD